MSGPRLVIGSLGLAPVLLLLCRWLAGAGAGAVVVKWGLPSLLVVVSLCSSVPHAAVVVTTTAWG